MISVIPSSELAGGPGRAKRVCLTVVLETGADGAAARAGIILAKDGAQRAVRLAGREMAEEPALARVIGDAAPRHMVI